MWTSAVTAGMKAAIHLPYGCYKQRRESQYQTVDLHEVH